MCSISLIHACLWEGGPGLKGVLSEMCSLRSQGGEQEALGQIPSAARLPLNSLTNAEGLETPCNSTSQQAGLSSSLTHAVPSFYLSLLTCMCISPEAKAEGFGFHN